MGTAALIIGANLPDVDAVAYLGGPLADLEWRRGWTHGVLAVVLLPFLLTGALVLVHRLRARRTSSIPDLEPKQLLLLSAVAILSHPVLDTLNTYGVRWLMPFSGRWYYGDALFIVDPWVWLMLAAGAIWSWRRRRAGARSPSRPARWALGMFGLYAVAMWVAGVTVRMSMSRNVEAKTGGAVLRAMAAPLPITLRARSYVAEQDTVYRVGIVRLPLAGAEVGAMRSYPKVPPLHPAYALAESTVVVRRFLGWARFPTVNVERVHGSEYLVHLIDLRYARKPGDRFGALTVRMVLPESGDRKRRAVYTVYNILNTGE